MPTLVLLLALAPSAQSSEFWHFPEDTEAFNDGRLGVQYNPRTMAIQPSGRPFGVSEDRRIQAIDHDLFRKIDTSSERRSRRTLRQTLDFSAFAGYDFVLTEGYEGGQTYNDDPIYQQVYFHIPDNGNSDLPSFFVNRPRGVNFSFWKSFPRFEVPAGKTFDLLATVYDTKNDRLVDLSGYGWNGLRIEGGGVGDSRADFDYDVWAINGYRDTGAGSLVPKPTPAQWLDQTSIEKLKAFFFKDANGISGYAKGDAFKRVYLDFEFFGLGAVTATQTGWDKMAEIFRATKKEHPQTELMIWTAKPYHVQYHERIDLTPSDLSWSIAAAKLTADDYDRPLAELKSIHKVDDWVSKDIFKELGSIEALGYMNQMSENATYHLIHEIEVERRLFPGKRIVPVFWHWVEILTDRPWGLSEHSLRLKNGGRRSVPLKPIVPPSTLHSVAAWSLFLADGMTMWSGSRPLNDDETVYAQGEPTSGSPAPGNKNSRYPTHTTQGLDWATLAAYQLSQPLPKSIIEAQTPISEPEFSLDGRNWSKGYDYRPPYAEVQKLPVIRAKPSLDQKNWLVLSVDRNGGRSIRDVWVRIGGRKAKIKLKGFFTTIQILTTDCSALGSTFSEEPKPICLEKDETSVPELKVTVGPIPVVDGHATLRVYLPFAFDERTFSYQLFDLRGSLLEQREAIETTGNLTEVPLDLSRLPAGTYTLQINLTNTNRRETVKIIKFN